MTLLFKELKKTIFSVVFIAYVLVLMLYINGQAGTARLPDKPSPTDQTFGEKDSEDYTIIVPKAVTNLYHEFVRNSYRTYPHGFYKNVRLDDYKRLKVAKILTQLTTFSKGVLIKKDTARILEEDIVMVNKEEFLKLMKEADNLLGGGSQYSEIYLDRFGTVPMTYEEAMQDYELMVAKDKYWGARARLVADYLGIMLAILPVFPAMWLVLKDRRARMQDVLYSKQLSSFKIISTRYMAIVIATFLPVLYVATKESIDLSHISDGLNVDYLAFYKYSFGWLLPTLMFSTAVAVLVTELTNTPLAALVGGIIWYTNVSAGVKFIGGGSCGMNLIPRHNSMENTQVFLDGYSNLLVNRLGYFLLSLCIVGLTIIVYELKRRGKINGWVGFKKVFKHNSL